MKQNEGKGWQTYPIKRVKIVSDVFYSFIDRQWDKTKTNKARKRQRRKRNWRKRNPKVAIQNKIDFGI